MDVGFIYITSESDRNADEFYIEIEMKFYCPYSVYGFCYDSALFDSFN